MRALSIFLIALLALLQYPLWLGKGSWLRVWELDRQLSIQRAANHKHELRNAALESDVGDLKQGYVAIEEIARYELGMIRSDEIFVQFNATGMEKPVPVKPIEGHGKNEQGSGVSLAESATAAHR
jgi:cell division protein FtsB